MLVASGRVSILGLARWTEKAQAHACVSSYRTIQRLKDTILPWYASSGCFFRNTFLRLTNEYLIAGHKVVVSNAGKETYKLDRFSAGMQQQVIPGLSFFAFSLVDVREEQSYPPQISQIVKSEAENSA